MFPTVFNPNDKRTYSVVDYRWLPFENNNNP